MQIQSKNDSLKDPPMFVNTGGGGKGIRPNQHNQQQQQHQAQQHHHHQSHHQAHHQQHQQHQQQQPQLQSGSLHQSTSQSSGNSHPHPHQQQASAPPPHQQQYQHHQLPLQFYPYALSPLHPQAPGQNTASNVAASQLAPSPPTHAGGNSSQGGQLATGASAAGGSVGSGTSNTAGNTVSTGRQGNTTNTMSHYSAGNPILQGTLQPPANSHFMTSPFMQLQQQNTVMVAAQYNNAAVAAAAVGGQHGNPSAGQTGATLYQTQPRAQASATHQPLYHMPGGPTGLHHSSHQHQQLRNLFQAPAGQIYLVAAGLAPQRSSLLTNAHQQQTGGSGGHVAAQLQNTANRGAGAGPTGYVQPPYCTPPIQMGAATAMGSQAQPLVAGSGIGPPLMPNAFCPLGSATAASTSSASLNMSSLGGGGGPTSSSTGSEHPGLKLRKNAIPIIHPITMQPVKFEPQSKGSSALDIKAPSDAENKPARTTTVTLTAPPELEKTPKDSEKSTTVATETAAVDPPPAKQADTTTPATVKIDQQMQTDVIKDNKAQTPPLLAQAVFTETTQPPPPCVVSAQTSGIEENDDTDADTPELEHDDDAFTNRSEAIGGSSPPLQTATTNTNDNTISRDCGEQLTAMDSNDTDQTTETDVKSMSQMDDDTNCNRLKSDDGYPQKQHIDAADPQQQQVVGVNNLNASKLESVTPKVDISVPTSKDSSPDVHKILLETDDSIATIQRKTTVAASDEDNAAPKPELNAASVPAPTTTKTEEPNKSSKPAAPPQSNPNNNNNNNNSNNNHNNNSNNNNNNSNNNNNNKPQMPPTPIDSNMRNSKSNTTLKSIEISSAAAQQQQQANEDAFITVSNRKKGKIAAKRNAKDNVKKPPHQAQMPQHPNRMHTTERSNSTTSTNSNSNNRSHNNTNSNNNNTRNVSAPATNVQQHQPSNLTDVHNANSSIPSSINNRNGNKQQHQQASQTTFSMAIHNNTNMEATAVKGREGGVVSLKDSENNGKQIKAPETVDHQQQQEPSKASSPEAQDNLSATIASAKPNNKQDERPKQFPNITSAPNKHEEEQRQQQQQQQTQQPEMKIDAVSQTVRLAEFKENEKQPEPETNAATTSNKSRASPDTAATVVDCINKQAPGRTTGMSTTISTKANKMVQVATLSTEENMEPIRRYSLETLKSLATSPDSRKVPSVPCDMGDCVSQIFVSQQNKQLVGGMHMPQQYQQMNFHENMEFIGAKRRSQQRKQHDHQIITASCGNIPGVAGVAVGSSVGMTGGSVSVTGTSFVRPVRMIRVNFSLNEEIKLSESENAWQPTPHVKMQDPAAGNDTVEGTVKKVRGVLNKLTPDNFDVLLRTMVSISLDTAEKMQSVMLLIFEKTISEPNFAPTYARFCQVLFNEVKPQCKSQFTSSIIKRIQTEFEDNVNKADAKKKTLQPLVDKLKTCTDPKERLETEAEIEDKEYQFRRRAWGTVRFIGEMYKLRQLTADRVMICVESLQTHGSEEKLEYMCKLLTTVGPLIDELSIKSVGRDRMDKVFGKISETIKSARPNPAGKTKLSISSRVRFMMQDVVDLRLRNWDQTSTHASKAVASVNTSGSAAGGSSSQHQQRKRNQDDKNSRNNFDRGGSSHRMGYSGSNSQRQNRMDRDGGSGGGSNYYSKNSQKSNYQQEDKPIDFKKFTFLCDDSSSDTQLGRSSAYKWRLCGKSTPAGPMQNATNPLMSGMPTAGSQRYGGSSGNNSSSSNNNVKRPTNQFHVLSTKESDADRPSASQTSASSSSNEESELEENSISASAAKEYKKQINGFVEEFLLDCSHNNNFDWQSTALKTWRGNSMKEQVELMYYLLVNYLHLVEVSRVERSACATVFLYLLRTKAFDTKTFRKAYDQFAVEFNDVLVDVPEGWTYVFEFLGPLLHDRLLSFDDIWRSIWTEDQPFTEKFVRAFVAYFTKEFGANYVRDLWHKEYDLQNGHKFIADEENLHKFIDSQGLKFLFNNTVKPSHEFTSCSLTDDQKMKRLEAFLKGGNNCDLAIDYINTNVNINNSFIKKLTNFLCCDYATVMKSSFGGGGSSSSSSSSSSAKKDDVSKNQQQIIETFRKCCHPLLYRCIDAKEEYEAICLDTVYESMQRNYDSKTASEFICNIFDVLDECEVISKESFDKWYKQHNSRGGQLSPQLQTYMQKLL